MILNDYSEIFGCGVRNEMKTLVINCSPVKNGATAEIVRIVSEQLFERMTIKNICIDDYHF